MKEQNIKENPCRITGLENIIRFFLRNLQVKLKYSIKIQHDTFSEKLYEIPSPGGVNIKTLKTNEIILTE